MERKVPGASCLVALTAEQAPVNLQKMPEDFYNEFSRERFRIASLARTPRGVYGDILRLHLLDSVSLLRSLLNVLFQENLLSKYTGPLRAICLPHAVNALIWVGEKLGSRFRLFLGPEGHDLQFGSRICGIKRAAAANMGYFRIPWLLLPLLCTSSSADCSFDAVAEFRSSRVKNGFDPARLDGLWYEQLYADFAQHGASCQELEFRHDVDRLESNFSVLYHGGPFTIKEHYESKGVTGIYRKYVTIPGGFPGGSLIGMPTAVVDIIPDGSGTKYDAMILYSCWSELMKVVEVATRKPVVEESILEEADAHSTGIISPQFDEWNPVRWFHHDAHGLQKELYKNATASAVTAEQFSNLKKWIEGGPGGWVSSKLIVNDYLSEKGRYDRRLEVTESVAKDEVLVKLPLSHVLSADFCQQDLTDQTIRQVVDAQKRSSEPVDIAPWTWITLYTLAHAKKDSSAPSSTGWRFDTLLKQEYIDAALSYLPLFWDDASLHWLNGTDLLNVHVLDVHAAIETEYHKLSYLVPSIESSITVVEPAALLRDLGVSSGQMQLRSLADLAFARLQDPHARCKAPAALLRKFPATVAAKVAFLVSTGRGEEAQRTVELLHAKHHVYVICAPRTVRPSLDDWIRERKLKNVFVISEMEPDQAHTSKDLRLEATRLLLEYHSWDYLVDLASGAWHPAHSGLLSRWLALLNGTSVVSGNGGSFAVSRAHAEEVTASLDAPEPRKLWAKASWPDFWAQALSSGQVPKSQGIRPFLESQSNMRLPGMLQTWSIVSPVEAYDAGESFKALSSDWLSLYANLTLWLVHALMAKSSGDRVQSVAQVSRRTFGSRRIRRTAESLGRLADALTAEVIFSPADGKCEIQGAVKGLQLHDCRIDAEIFFMERLFVADPFPPGPALGRRTEPCGISFPHVFRVGTGWDGDEFLFHGFASLIPAAAAGDLWAVLIPLVLVEPKGEKPEHPWFGPLEIRWIDAEGMVRYRGGGQAVRPGAIWERYLGSALPPGSYTVSVHIRRGPLLAQRSFEVLPEDLSTMEPAERLRLLPQYFDLLDEPEHLGDQGTPTAQLTGTSSHSTRDNTATTTTTTGTATSTTTSTNREPKMPRRETVTARQAPEPGKLKPVGSSGSVFRPGAKDREWLRKDVQRAAARRSRVAQTRLRSLRTKPKTAAERWQREVEWIRRDVEAFAPRRLKPKAMSTLQKDVHSAPQKEASAPQNKVLRQRPGPPVDASERQRREKLWIEQEAQKLRAAKAPREVKAAASAASTLHSKEEVKEPRSVSGRLPSPAAAESTWIRRDLAVHEPLRRQRCQGLQLQSASKPQAHRDFLRTACASLFMIDIDVLPKNVAGVPTLLPHTAPRPSPAPRRRSNFTHISAKVKQQLSGIIPDGVVDKELPWILDDIDFGQRIRQLQEMAEFKKWAMVVMSRGETVNLPDRDNKSQTSPQLAIMPLIDLVDHHLPMPEEALHSYDDLTKFQERGSRTNISYDADSAAVTLKAKEVLPANTAVTVGYGVRSNADYLLYHGFTMPQRWSDVTLCAQYTMIELPLPTDFPAWKSRYLPHSYRFALPACPSRKSTPHVAIGAARFLVATEEDVVSFEDRLAQDSSLLDGAHVNRGDKFLHHAAQEAVTVVCDVKVQPPLCRVPLSVSSERAAWEFVKRQTLARVAQHVGTISEDDRLLAQDDSQNSFSINQRHAVIVRREERMVLRSWCNVVVRIAAFLNTPQAEESMATIKLPDDQVLENDEPRQRPRYWERLLADRDAGHVEAECASLS
ncbi:unnamed protein product [Symbiodinium microadriaticum]|nr:unnamed protein product [Symbiodinium microadriaticum]